jgi:hypothetical protein
MSRRLLIATVAPLLGAALIAPAAASAQPTPTPTGSPTMTTSPGSGSPGMTTPPAAPPATDTPTVCKNVASTFKGGWPPIEATLQQAKTQALKHQLSAAQSSVKQAGQQLQALGAQVKQDGSQATDANLKNTLTSMGDQLTSLGASTNSVTSLKSFNPGKLTPLSKQLATQCKGQLSGVPLPG